MRRFEAAFDLFDGALRASLYGYFFRWMRNDFEGRRFGAVLRNGVLRRGMILLECLGEPYQAAKQMNRQQAPVRTSKTETCYRVVTYTKGKDSTQPTIAPHPKSHKTWRISECSETTEH